MSLVTKFLNNETKKINLDLPEKERWLSLLNEYKSKLEPVKPKFVELIEGMFGIYLYPLIATIKLLRNTSNQIMHVDEIQSIADFLDISFEYALLLQLCYEANSCCTSTVTKVNGEYTFYRTMDWPMELLNDLTVDLEFYRGGKVIFKATSWVGYIGIATATVPEKYSLAINFRLTQTPSLSAIVQNLKNAVGMNWPIGYLIRHICENELNYDQMLVNICTANLITPCYVTICGVTEKPKIVTRSPTKYEIHIDDFVVQTNCDQCKEEPDILYSVNRLYFVTKEIKLSQNNFSSVDILMSALTKFPVVNEETIYLAIMNPKTGYHCSLTNYSKSNEILRF